MTSLIAYTNKTDLACNRVTFGSFSKALKDINPNITKTDVAIIKEILEEEQVTAEELQTAFIAAYKDYNRYGKVEFNLIWKHIELNRQNFNPDKARAFYES